MNPPRLFSSDEVITALIRAGFRIVRKSRGSHQGLIKPKPDGGHYKVTVVLGKQQIPLGTFREILKQAGIGYDEFLVLAKVKK